jgi:hypothetical protein
VVARDVASGAAQPVHAVLADADAELLVDPARYRDRHPNVGTGRGHLTDERENHLLGRFASDR